MFAEVIPRPSLVKEDRYLDIFVFFIFAGRHVRFRGFFLRQQYQPAAPTEKSEMQDSDTEGWKYDHDLHAVLLMMVVTASWIRISYFKFRHVLSSKDGTHISKIHTEKIRTVNWRAHNSREKEDQITLFSGTNLFFLLNQCQKD